jgi:hypothetical protein
MQGRSARRGVAQGDAAWRNRQARGIRSEPCERAIVTLRDASWREVACCGAEWRGRR